MDFGFSMLFGLLVLNGSSTSVLECFLKLINCLRLQSVTFTTFWSSTFLDLMMWELVLICLTGACESLFTLMTSLICMRVQFNRCLSAGESDYCFSFVVHFIDQMTGM